MGHLILRYVIKIVATKCQILRLKWGSLQRSPTPPQLDFTGPTSKEGEGRTWERKEEEDRGGEGD